MADETGRSISTPAAGADGDILGRLKREIAKHASTRWEGCAIGVKERMLQDAHDEIERLRSSAANAARVASEPDGYAVIMDDKASSPRGFWFVGAWLDKATAEDVRSKHGKGTRVEPIYFGTTSATGHTAITQHGLLDATADMLDAHGYGGAAREVRKAKKEMPDCPITNWWQHGL